ncbi:MAG: response regulator transcription factor [Planctomycetota bacterium]
MAPRAKILIVEDEPDMAMGLRDNLVFEGYEVLSAPTGEKGLELAKEAKPDCILLDIMLPGIDGYETCSRLRRQGNRCPIIMLTARGQEIDKVRGLELGADDYVTKPFGLKELLARIQAVLRRAAASEKKKVPESAEIGKVSVDLVSGRARRGRKEIQLGYYEAEILKMLLMGAGEVVDRSEILREIWGLENEPFNRSVDNHIVSLRRKIEDDPSRPRHLLTVHGIGYKLVL